ncbi:phage antirepressor KilAC domain-containing protein [Bacteroides fragilis]|nr:phage antirepressor KilAC domain-containing protein [Bacteroides fragilis]
MICCIKAKEIGVIYRQSGQWLLHTPYSTWGLHSTRTQTYTRSDGSIGTNVYTVWTTKGVRFIIALCESGWDVKKAIKLIKGIKHSVHLCFSGKIQKSSLCLLNKQILNRHFSVKLME